MIEKMAFVHVTGPKDEFDRIIDEYISNYEIHLENAILQLEGQGSFIPFTDPDPYKELIDKANDISSLLTEQKKGRKRLLKKTSNNEMSREDACRTVDELYEALSSGKVLKAQLLAEKESLESDLEMIAPFKGLAYKLEDIRNFKYVAYRFGKLPIGAYNYYKHSSVPRLSNIFAECQRDENFVWGVYFVPENEDSKVDSIFASLNFTWITIPDNYDGTPTEICDMLEKRISQIEANLADNEEAGRDIIRSHGEDFFLAKEKLTELSHNFDARRYAAIIEDDEDFDGIDTPFFVLRGWMKAGDAEDLQERLEKEEKEIICIADFRTDEKNLAPPTSIKNPGIFRPYEMYVKMYGLPAYNEFDPTIIVALLYSFIFGAMFGDLGHGLCLLIGGAAIYFIKKSQIAGIISFAGFFASIFGLLYGSFFGFEDIIPTLWLKPREAMSTLPFIGRLNTIFAIAVLFGMLLMLVLMILNVASHIKQRDFVGSIFTSNGIAGFLFYGTVVLIVVLYMTGNSLPATIIVIALIVISVLMMVLNEPLTNIIKKHKALETGVGMFAVEAFFDLFETMLSYFSNTLSFVRVGAFAVSHAAMMEVVLSLGHYTDGGNGSIAVLIIGNIFVMGFEGLIVGIQVLRLQYYEIFSKFYKGDGREFKPFFKRRNS